MKLTGDFYKKVLDNLYDGIYFLDQDKKIIYWNAGAEKHTGYKSSEVLGRHCWDNLLMHVDAQGNRLCNGSCPITQTAADGMLREMDIYFHHKEGHLVPVSLRIAPIEDSAGEVVVAVEIVSENSPKFTIRQQLEELQKIALLDPLTKLVNRRYIELNLTGKLEELKRYGWQFGVLFIDIDHFKSVNDRYGHDMGDNILNMVGKTISNTLRPFDIAGRWGGEEFVAIIVNVQKEQLHSVANRVRALVEKSGININGDIVHATVSIGATLAQPEDTITALINRADQLMYKSKNSGRNAVSTDPETA